LLESLIESEIIADGVLAQDETQVLGLWSLRESLPEAAGKLGKVYKYDLSMPVKDMYSLVEEARERFNAKGLIEDGSIKTTIGYGHLGDGECSFYTLRTGNNYSNATPFHCDQEIYILTSLLIDGTLRLRR
jgi:FAD/FMN-containing dehydrogenase